MFNSKFISFDTNKSKGVRFAKLINANCNMR